MLIEKFECSAVLLGCEIEFTNYCGFDCRGCIRKKSPDFGFLSFESLQKIIDIVSDQGYKEIVISGLGDAFLHKDFYKYIDYIFARLPNICVYIMTKGQSITQQDIDTFFSYTSKGFNLNLTFSIFSLERSLYKKITGGGSLSHLIDLIKIAFQRNIYFNFEFLLDTENIRYIKKYKRFCDIFGKEFRYSIPHNWGGSLSKDIYSILFESRILMPIIEKRKKDDICEAFSGKYMFFDFHGKIYKCGLNRFSDDLYLGSVYEKKNSFDMEKLDYNTCKKCSYFSYKTRMSG